MAGIGVITVGNSGVGKSLLGNILLDKEAFVHDYSADSVTACVEAEVIVTGTDWGNVLIFNLPGLIEANSKKIERNKLELQKAFNNCSHQVTSIDNFIQ